jgi:hypothetical protein
MGRIELTLAYSGADGVYLDDCQLRRPSKWAYDAGKAERLWVLSEELVQNKFNHGRESKM